MNKINKFKNNFWKKILVEFVFKMKTIMHLFHVVIKFVEIVEMIVLLKKKYVLFVG